MIPEKDGRQTLASAGVWACRLLGDTGWRHAAAGVEYRPRRYNKLNVHQVRA